MRGIAERFDLSLQAVMRHSRAHLPDALAKAEHAAEMAHGNSLLEQLQGLQTTARQLGQQAAAEKKYTAALQAVRELVRIVELMARMRGELQEGAQVNIVMAPEWVSIRTGILRALEPYPGARAAVVEVLTHAGD